MYRDIVLVLVRGTSAVAEPPKTLAREAHWRHLTNNILSVDFRDTEHVRDQFMMVVRELNFVLLIAYPTKNRGNTLFWVSSWNASSTARAMAHVLAPTATYIYTSMDLCFVPYT